MSFDVRIETLGTFSITAGGRAIAPPSTLKARALLTYLAMHPGRDLAREQLMETFWPLGDPQRARDSLNTALHTIRRCFRVAGFVPDGFVQTGRVIVRWIAKTELDAASFAALGRSPDASVLRAALDLYGGDFLPGCYDDWSVGQRERLCAEYERALGVAVKQFADVDAARTLIEFDPYDESAYTLLLGSSARRSSFATASLAARCRSIFEECGIQPSSELERRLECIPVWHHERPVLPFVSRDRERRATKPADARRARGV